MTEKSDKSETLEPEVQATEEAVTEDKEEKFDEARAKELITKLRATEKQAKKDAVRLAQLEKDAQTRADAEKSDLQKAQELAAQLVKDKRELEIRILKRDAAAKVKLPDVLVDRLRGETPEELEADALALMAAIPSKQPPQTNPTNPGGVQTGETDAERRKRLGL